MIIICLLFNTSEQNAMQNQQPQAVASSLVEIFGEPISTYSREQAIDDVSWSI